MKQRRGTKAVYTFNVTVWFDGDTDVDSGTRLQGPGSGADTDAY